MKLGVGVSSTPVEMNTKLCPSMSRTGCGDVHADTRRLERILRVACRGPSFQH